MKNILQTTWPLFFGIAMVMVGNGLQGTLLGIRATIEGFSTVTTGLIMSLYYGGFLAGCILAPKFVKDVGHIRVFTALASLASTTALLHGLFIDPVIWSVARIIAGFCFAGLYIVVESWMNDVSTNQTRGRILGVYLLTFYGAMVLGQYALNLAPPDQIELFILISILISLALLPISLSKRPAPDFQAPKPTSLKGVYQASPLGVIAVTISGAASGIVFAIGPVYASQTGMSISQIANFMALYVMGGMCAQLPLGMISDWVARRKLIIIISFLAGLSSIACYFYEGNVAVLNLMFFFTGSMGLSIYGLGSAYTNDHLERDQFVGASSMLILINGCGAFAGPLVAALFMGAFGPQAFFPLVAIIFLAVTIFALYRASVRPVTLTTEEQGPLMAVPPRATTILAQIAEETETEEGA